MEGLPHAVASHSLPQDMAPVNRRRHDIGPSLANHPAPPRGIASTKDPQVDPGLVKARADANIQRRDIVDQSRAKPAGVGVGTACPDPSRASLPAAGGSMASPGLDHASLIGPSPGRADTACPDPSLVNHPAAEESTACPDPGHASQGKRPDIAYPGHASRANHLPAGRGSMGARDLCHASTDHANMHPTSTLHANQGSIGVVAESLAGRPAGKEGLQALARSTPPTRVVIARSRNLPQ